MMNMQAKQVWFCLQVTFYAFGLSFLGFDRGLGFLNKSKNSLYCATNLLIPGSSGAPQQIRPLCRVQVVTCGIDKSARVWNYFEKTCVMCRWFNEEARVRSLSNTPEPFCFFCSCSFLNRCFFRHTSPCCNAWGVALSALPFGSGFGNPWFGH